VPEENLAVPETEPAEAETEVVLEDSPRPVVAEWVVTVLLLLFGTTTLVQAFVIPTGSMEDNLLIGDHLLVDKLAYAPAGVWSRYLLPYTSVQRGDVIVFRFPVDPQQTFVKRCIGLPGDRIRIVDKQVHVNGERLDEPYKVHKTAWTDYYRDNFPGPPNTRADDRALEMLAQHVRAGEVVVPPDHYFALGDNRDSSLDSRYWGFVPRSHVVGKPVMIYWSYDAPTERLAASGISLEHLKDLARHFFSKTRWRRSLQLIRGHRSPQ
jgi:signal peptidase I